MKAMEMTIGSILTGDQQFVVPPYQRPYKWDVEAAEQLAQDIYDSHLSPSTMEYFIGSVICIKKNGSYEIVDGQQRLITLTLLMEQMKAITNKDKIRHILQDRILQDNPFSEENDTVPVPTLMVRAPERDFYLRRILMGEDIPCRTETERVFLKNQEKLGDFLRSKEQTDITRMAGYLLQKVYIVFVEVDNRASSFRLFNVLNSRGLPLNDADLLKSALLGQVANSGERSRIVERQWQAIEDIAEEQGEELDNFLALHQISEKKDRDRVKGKNFEYYDGRLNGGDFGGDATKMSDMLLSSAECYGDILGGQTNAKGVTAFLSSFAGHGEWMPAFMAFFNSKQDRNNFPEFASLFEKVYMQAWLIGMTKSQREAACYYAVEAINNGQPYEKILEAVRARAENQEFEKSLDAKYFYDGSRPRIINLVKSVLLRVDRARHDDITDPNPDLRKITVEHILPQTMTAPYWTDRFTPAQHEEWRHKLGNLTLLSGRKNSAARNHGFDKKKDAYEQANKKTPFDITKEVCGLSEWNMDKLQERHENLKREIKDLWLV